MSISFNGQKLDRELDLIVRVQLPFLAAVTVNRLGTVVRQALQHEMQTKFTSLSAFTYKSPLYHHLATKAQPYTTIYLRDEATKGQPPSTYLLPQITGGMVYKTRFQERLASQLSNYNGRYMLPLHESPAAKRNQQGRIRASQYVEALYGIKAFEDIRASVRPGRYRTEGSHIYVPYVGARKELQKVYRAIGKGRLPQPGIYRVKSGNLTQLFRQLEAVPSVPAKFKFEATAQNAVQINAGAIFDAAVKQFV